MREICLDIETTGLNPHDGHRIVEIACIELINKVKTNNFFHTYVNPRRDVPQEAYAIHGISTEFLQDKPIFDHVVNRFLDFIKDTKVIIHNANFDTKFINYELALLGMPKLDMSLISDSLAMARNKFPGSPNSLDALCKRFFIDLSKRTKHGALLDTELLCDVYIELTGGLQTKLELDQEIVNANEHDFSTLKTRKKHDFPRRFFSASESELELHEEFIEKNFKETFWPS